MAQTAMTVRMNARAAFESLRSAAERGETPELTLDEINSEIKEVRRLRKERNGYTNRISPQAVDTWYIANDF